MQKNSLWPAVTVLILYTGLLFAGFAWMLSVQTKQVNAQIEPIKEILNNHITDTNKKIEKLTDRFDRLYEIILKEKTKK